MNDDIINLESRLVFRDVSKLTAGGMSTAAALAHAAHEAAERKAKMTTGFAQDDYIRSLEEQIATLQSDLAAVREELARAKAEIMQLWVCQAVKAKTTHNDAVIYAEARYAREIAHKGEEG